MLKQRVATAVVLAICFVVVLLLPAIYQLLAVVILLSLGMWEFLGLCHLSVWLKRILVSVFSLSLLAAALNFDSIDNAMINNVLLLATALWAMIFLWVLSYPASASIWARPSLKVLQAFVLLGGAWCAFAVVIVGDYALFHLAYIVAVVAAADIGAYFSGKAFGKHKLAVKVSPGKTWQGFLGGLAAALCLGLLAIIFAQDMLLVSTAGHVLLTVFCACISVIGDLYESMLKREVGAKDSGTLLPGHGGFLDRIDGLIAAITLYSFVLLNTGL